MTRGDMKDLLGSQLQDTGDTEWSDARKNLYLNLGLQFIQTKILEINPEAYQEISKTDIVYSGGDFDDLIAKPQGLLRILKVWLKYSTDTDYVQATHKRRDQLISAGNNNDPSYLWAHKGRWIQIHPVPLASSTDGCRLEFVPTLSMGADTDVPDVPLVAHRGIVYAARLEALAETGEDTDPQTTQAIQAKLGEILSRMATYYTSEQGEVDQIEVGLNPTDGW